MKRINKLLIITIGILVITSLVGFATVRTPCGDTL